MPHTKPATLPDYFHVDYDPRVEAAVEELLNFWQKGHDSLAETPVYERRRNGRKTTEAARLSWSPEKLRQARSFAGRCSRDELEERIAEARHAGYRPRWSTLIALYAVSDRRARLQLWKATIAQNLARRDILARIRSADLARDIRVGHCGRKVRVPKDAKAAEQHLKELTRLWLSTQQASLACLRLTPARRRAIRRAQRAMADLLKRLA